MLGLIILSAASGDQDTTKMKVHHDSNTHRGVVICCDHRDLFAFPAVMLQLQGSNFPLFSRKASSSPNEIVTKSLHSEFDELICDIL